jgi:SAM-dependent methyltransferase
LIFFWWYLRRPPWDTRLSPPELLDFIQSHPPGRALDLGCGTGTNVITLARAGWNTTGVDFIPRAIEQARRAARQAGVTVNLLVGDVLDAPRLGGPYDLILDMGCYHSLRPQDRQCYRDNLVSLLAPGGSFLLYAFITPGSAAMPGIPQGELEALAARLPLTWRKDGSERGRRASAWLEYRKP